jgi:hypothetical protein
LHGISYGIEKRGRPSLTLLNTACFLNNIYGSGDLNDGDFRPVFSGTFNQWMPRGRGAFFVR